MARRLTAALSLTAAIAAAGCGKQQPAADVPPPALPLPTAGIAGQPVAVYPLTLIASDEALGWQDDFRPRREALTRADSIIASGLTERSPEVTWVLPDVLRRGANQAPGLLANPDQLGTAMLRARNLAKLPDPLWSQMRGLTAFAGARWALVPASLIYSVEAADGQAELVLVLVDVRSGAVGWRSHVRGTGDGPWVALRAAVNELVPGLP